MSTRLFGVLVDGLNKPIINATVTLLARQNTLTILNGSEAVFRTDATGFYNITVQSGHYNVIVGPQGIEPYKAGEIAIYADSAEGSLNGYLVDWVPEELTPEVIKEVQDLVARSEQFALDAGRSASSANLDATDARTSKTAAQTAASEALTYKNDAKAEADSAKLAQQGASGSANTATLAVTTVQNLKTDVEQLKSDTQTIKDTAVLDVTAIKNTAEGAATTATQKALEAAGSATTAEQKASEADSAADRAETAAASAEQVTQASLKKVNNLSDLTNNARARRNINTPVGSRAVTIPDGENVLAFVAAQAESGYYSCGNNATQLPTSNEGFWFFNFHCHGINNSGVADYGHLTAIGGSTGRMWHCRLNGLATWTGWQVIVTGDDPLNSRYHLGLENFIKSGIEARVTDPSNPQRYFYINSDPTNPWGAYDLTAGTPIPLSVRGGGTGASNEADARSKLGLGSNDYSTFKALTLNGKDYSFTMIGGEQNYIQMYAASNPPLDDWANFTRYNWYNDLSVSGSVRSGSDKIKCHRIRVDSPSIDTSDFDFYPKGYLKARAFNAGTTTSHYGWGIEQSDSGNAIPFNSVSTISKDGSFAPVVAGGTSTPGGWYTRFAIGMLSPGATGWSKPVIKVLGDNDKHRGFEFSVSGDLYTWQNSPNGVWGGNYDYAKNPTSDRDLKHDIQYTDGKESYDRVMQWLPTMFKYNGADIQRYGLIAQDLAKIDLQYVKIVPGSPVFEDVIGVDEDGNEYVDRQIETDRADDTLALDSNVVLTDMACAMVYMGSQLEQQRKELDELKAIINTLTQAPNPDIP